MSNESEKTESYTSDAPFARRRGSASWLEEQMDMKQLFQRGLMTGLVGGIGADLFFVFLDVGQATPGGMALGLFAGLCGGAILGLVMMLLLAFLRYIDQRKGWSLASRLEASEPGPLGFLFGLLATFPGRVWEASA